MFVPLALVYAMKSVDSEDATNLMLIRLFFGVAVVFQLSFWAFVWLKVRKNGDERKLSVKQADLQPPNPLGTALGADKLLPQEETVMTVGQYDASILRQRAQQVVLGGFIVLGMHIKMQI